MRQTKKQILEGLKNIKSSKKIDNNTYEIIFNNGEKAIRLHNTNIIAFKPNGDIILNSGGWNTPTTKNRISEYSPYHIRQKNRIWYIDVNGIEYTFKDDMRITKNNKVYGAGNTDKLLKIKKQINIYVKNYMKKLINRELNKPSGGDCWYCYMRNKDGSIGELFHDNSHIKQHIKEKYYVPSLIINATKQIPISIFANNVLGYYFKYHNENVEGFTDMANRQIESSLKRYLNNQMGLSR